MKALLFGALAMTWTARLFPAADGGQPMAFFKLGQGSREIAMGRVAAPDANDPFAFGYNPADLALLAGPTLGAEAAFLAGDRSLDHLVYAQPFVLEGWKLWGGLSYTRFALDAPIELRAGNSPEPDSSITDAQNALQVSLAAWIWKESLALGVHGRWFNDSLGEAAGSGLSGDLGLLYRAHPRLDLGLALVDPFGSVSWNTGLSEALAPTLRATVTLRGDHGLLFCGEWEQSSAQQMKGRAGVEWQVVVAGSQWALRGGIDQAQPSLGAGWKGMAWGVGVALDWSLAAGPYDLGLSQRLSLTLDWKALKA